MQLYQLKPTYKKKSRKRIGRGGKKGTYSGKGIKGQKSRSGKKPRVDFAGGDTTLSKRLPKKRGTTGKHKATKKRKGAKMNRLRTQSMPVILNLKDIEKKFSAKGGPASGSKEREIVSPQSLLEMGLISRIKGRIPKVKILGKCKIKQNLEFKNVKTSKSVQVKIVKINKHEAPR